MKTAGEITVVATDPFKINVLLAYDSVQTCGAILGMFDRISTRLCDKKIFNVRAFKFGLLERMDPLKWPAARAGAAELMMVAFGEEGAPGAGLLRWLENWAENQEGQDSALGFLPMNTNADAPVHRVVRALRKIAARHDLRFIYGAEAGLGLPQADGTVVV